MSYKTAVGEKKPQGLYARVVDLLWRILSKEWTTTAEIHTIELGHLDLLSAAQNQ